MHGLQSHFSARQLDDTLKLIGVWPTLTQGPSHGPPTRGQAKPFSQALVC